MINIPCDVLERGLNICADLDARGGRGSRGDYFKIGVIKYPDNWSMLKDYTEFKETHYEITFVKRVNGWALEIPEEMINA